VFTLATSDFTDASVIIFVNTTVGVVQEAYAAAGRLELVGVSRWVRRVLQILNLDTTFGPEAAAQAV
jgi:hypothetical protein